MHEQFMKLAIDIARAGIEKGQSPFGALIVRGQEIVACEHNLVWATTDITAHAEITALRAACRQVKAINLAGCTIYSSTEPCPMCFSAIHWAGIEKIVYGANIADAQRAGFSELTISNFDMKRLGGSRVEIVADVMKAEAAALFDEWLRHPNHRAY